MAPPRARMTHTSPLSQPVLPADIRPSDSLPLPSIQLSRLRPRPLANEDKGEDFDLDVPGSDDDADKEEDDPPVPRSRGRTQGMTIEGVTQINDPGVPTQNESKSSAGDIHYFFERDNSTQQNVCTVCR